METYFLSPPYFEGVYQCFIDKDGQKWRRKFDFTGLSIHGEWDKVDANFAGRVKR